MATALILLYQINLRLSLQDKSVIKSKAKAATTS